MMLKIMTLNTWQERGPWKDRWDVILHGIKKYRPDIIAFQEVFNAEWAGEVQKRAGYPELVFPPEFSGLMFLSKHPVRRWECMTMQTQSPLEDYQRYALFAELNVDGASLCLFNTHLSWKTEDSNVRRNQVQELITFMDHRAGEKETLAMGDFNAPPETKEIKMMSGKAGFTDTFALCNPGDIGLTWDNKNEYAASGTKMPDRRIDYIFARNTKKLLAELKSVDLVFDQPTSEGIWASDHFGLMATFE